MKIRWRTDGGAARSIVALVALLLVLGCAEEQGAATADAPPHVLEAVERCRSGQEKQDCYQERILARLDVGGVPDALSTLERIAALDRDVERDGHVYVHAIGITAYRRSPDLSEVFPSCTELFQSGCYHGVIQAHFMASGRVDADVVNSLCESYKGAGADRWVLFQCLHGMGHGLMMFHDHDLPRALSACDLLREGWDRQSCYGGAFMENITSATMPHHPATELTADMGPPGEEMEGEADAEGGMAMGGDQEHETPASGWRALDPEDPHYPCSVLAGVYLRSCYIMQTSVMLWMNGGDIADAARSCDGAPRNMIPVCYQSLGRDISAYTLQDVEKSIAQCDKGAEEFRAWCYIGAVKNFIDLTARTDDAFEFCRAVESPSAKLKCYEAIGEEVAVLRNEEEQRAELCGRSEGEAYERACLWGARVLRIKPSGL